MLKQKTYFRKHTLTEEPPLDVSAVRGGSSVEVDTVGLEAIHPLSSSSPASPSLSLLLQRQKFSLPILRLEHFLLSVWNN
ncbi:hypothetical protein T4D_3590 [Trichinella pseudospiralis]|uniref:Uncharacterized protein n=1 Tax=Trichinella pseudospiralis TaxID=6337 RepID=A0A0V1FXV5_TRIPS|nr:hypothetical protein T4D_3590 [Trichinella pseudospiralis]